MVVFPLTSLIKFKLSVFKKTVNAVSNFKINGYLKFYFFNGWNWPPLTEQLEKVGTCAALIENVKNYLYLQPSTILKSIRSRAARAVAPIPI